MDRGAWQATVQKVAKTWTRLKGLSTQVHMQRENKVKIQAECHLQTRKCLRLTGVQERDMDHIFPHNPQKEPSSLTTSGP